MIARIKDAVVIFLALFAIAMCLLSPLMVMALIIHDYFFWR